jgi:hypothetical protein
MYFLGFYPSYLLSSNLNFPNFFSSISCTFILHLVLLSSSFSPITSLTSLLGQLDSLTPSCVITRHTLLQIYSAQVPAIINYICEQGMLTDHITARFPDRPNILLSPFTTEDCNYSLVLFPGFTLYI